MATNLHSLTAGRYRRSSPNALTSQQSVAMRDLQLLLGAEGGVISE
jgi:hypothetical protein